MIKLTKVLAYVGIFLLVLGGVSYIMEFAFYDYVDKNGVLQESLFLPLAFILGFLGIVLIFISSVIGLIKKLRAKYR